MHLNASVHVRDPETGQVEVYETGTNKSDVPRWAQDQITNEDVWSDGDPDEAVAAGPSQVEAFDPDSDEAQAKSEGGAPDLSKLNKSELQEVATNAGVDYDESWTKAELVDAITGATQG